MAGDGAPEGIRTPGLCLRRAALYPAELRVLGARLIAHPASPGKWPSAGGAPIFRAPNRPHICAVIGLTQQHRAPIVRPHSRG
jgi:hypothetical protein